jgi:hypothetical protein
MRGMISGNAVKVQLGLEGANTYGTLATMQRQIKIASEDFKYTPSKKQEGVLTGLIGASVFQTMGKRTENSLSFLARPDDLGIFLKAVLGSETVATVSGITTHTFTPIGNGLTDYLPSLSFLIDKKTDVFGYTGCKINSLSFSTAAEDFLNVEAEIYGKDELTGQTLSTSINSSPLKAFVFNGGSVKLGGSVMADITSISFNYVNNLENTLQTTSTGLYYKEPQPNLREITCELEMLYSTEAETFRSSFFKTDDIVSLELSFISNEIAAGTTPYSLTITIPATQVVECSNAISDANGVKQSASLTGIDNGVNPVCTWVLKNTYTSAYTAATT